MHHICVEMCTVLRHRNWIVINGYYKAHKGKAVIEEWSGDESETHTVRLEKCGNFLFFFYFMLRLHTFKSRLSQYFVNLL